MEKRTFVSYKNSFTNIKMRFMLTQDDLKFLAEKGISEEKLNAQLKCFETGFPWMKLAGAASPDNGIKVLSQDEKNTYLVAWADYLGGEGKVLKFVPASGAASRMFKDLFEYLDTREKNDFVRKFEEKLDQFAFAADLKKAVEANGGGDDVATAIDCLLGEKGLSYGKLPKGLLKFHKYADGARTPVEEHLVEGARYAKGKDGVVRVHFTVSPEHRPLFEALVAKVLPKYEKEFGVKYEVAFSEQKSSTDTVAANPDNTPFRGKDGKILFRPGGHGALIENLNDLDADVIFIKNIDNVVPDRLKEETVEYKQLIAGVLVSAQRQAFDYLRLLESGKYSHADLEEIIRFLRDTLSCRNPELKDLEDAELAIYLKNKLNRPMRVCGMVKNVGEPGGGPFLAYNEDGTISLQILESSQIDKNNAEYVQMFQNGTHFNPVDLVCAVKNYKGERFDLSRYVDPKTGFISNKSKDGKELKALELPGLWNGAMSDWNTIFVEVPLGTFNPVKTVNDLLRDQHQ